MVEANATEQFVKDIVELKAAIVAGNAEKEKLEKGLKEAKENFEKAMQGVGPRQTSYPTGGNASGEPSENGDLGNQAVLFQKNANLDEFKKWSDDVYLFAQILNCNPRSLKTYRRGEKEMFAKTATQSLTAGYGGSWVPTMFSDKVIETIHLPFQVDALFDYIDMPTNPYTIPAIAGDMTFYKTAESTADDSSKITASAVTTTSRTLTAAKMAGRLLFSDEVDEDSLIPMAETLKKNIGMKAAKSIESCDVNGDTGGTMDAGVGSTDVRRCWHGLRKHGLAPATDARTDLSSTNFTLANIRAIRGAMGVTAANAKNLAYITGTAGLIKLLGLAEVVTMDKLGANATVLSGQIGELDGSPVIISEEIPENLNAVGVYDGTSVTNKSVLLVVYRPGFVVGRRKPLTIRTFIDTETEQTVLSVSFKRVLQMNYDSATTYLVGYGYNF